MNVKRKNKIGLYLHIPFCAGKCPYCDFYSVMPSADVCADYTERLFTEMEYRKQEGICADTLYFGGGTPLLLGAGNLVRVIEKARQCFHVDSDDAEITVEINPGGDVTEVFPVLREAGVNRLSIGMQSALDGELRLLGRKHTHSDTVETLRLARAAGFSNVSLDLMLGIPGQTADSLSESLKFCIQENIPHVSAYLLKIEPGTRFAAQENLRLPDENAVCELYMQTVETLECAGIRQYEISNFARPGCESRHNLKYWRCEEYLGLGAAAHSFYRGERFYLPRSLRDCVAISDGSGGTFEEYAMLALRLGEGLTEAVCMERFGTGIPARCREKAELIEAHGLLINDLTGIRLTPKGFLLSNTVIAELLL